MQDKEIMMPPVPEDATAASLWIKLHNERKMWKDLIKKKEKQTNETLAQIRQIHAEWMALFIRTYGKYNAETGEYSLQMQKPDPAEMWAYGAELKDNGYLLKAKKIEV